MTSSGILRLRLTLTAFGFAIWAYGARTDQRQILWVGLGIMALALVARFIRPTDRRPPDDETGQR
jgi:hypothetical protein